LPNAFNKLATAVMVVSGFSSGNQGAYKGFRKGQDGACDCTDNFQRETAERSRFGAKESTSIAKEDELQKMGNH